jgi:flavin reductase (DIM6/NTAB) family NADH-FMN oxidoreductase RutF
LSGAAAGQRELFRRWPAGVSVVVAESNGRRAGLTVSSLVSLSLDPALVAIAISRSASLYEVLREAGEWGVSILAGGQDHLAQHFARNVPPIALWDRIAVRDDEPRLLAGAVGWLVVRTTEEVRGGDHSLFVGELTLLEPGPGAGSLVYLDRRYLAL